MLSLTQEQVKVLARFKLPTSSVLDARGMERSDWKIELKRQNKAVAFTDSLCKRNHTAQLRLSSGHCIECSPRGVAAWKKHQEPGFVYIAASPRLGLFKIGTAKVASERSDGIIRDGYGGADDWVMLYRRKFDKAGAVESKAKTALAPYAAPREYVRKGHGITVTAKELFGCEFEAALEAIEAQADSALGDRWLSSALKQTLNRVAALRS